MLGTDDRSYDPAADFERWKAKSKPRVRVKAWNEEHVVKDGQWKPKSLVEFMAKHQNEIYKERFVNFYNTPNAFLAFL